METQAEVTQLKTGQHVVKRTATIVHQEYIQAAVEVGNLHLEVEGMRHRLNKATMRMAELNAEYNYITQAEKREQAAQETSEAAEGVPTHGTN